MVILNHPLGGVALPANSQFSLCFNMCDNDYSSSAEKVIDVELKREPISPTPMDHVESTTPEGEH